MSVNNRHIFLSYRSTEADFALRLAADLKNAGINLWMDRLDIKPGDEWPTALQTNVDHAAAMISILSPEYITSKYCRRELTRADRHNCPIFPVLLHPVDGLDWPIEIERHQYIDFTDCQDAAVYRRKVQELVDVLKAHFGDQIMLMPSAEQRYLNQLIAELEARKDILEHDVPEVDEPTRPRPVGEDLWHAKDAFVLLDNQRRKTPLNGIEEALDRLTQFVLIGERGGGKTTILRRIALDGARRRLSAPQAAPLPLLIPMADWGPDQRFDEFLRSRWPLENGLDEALANGGVCLFLDGLDELGIEAPYRAAKLREWLAHHAGGPRVIVTCRSDDYTGAVDVRLPVVAIEAMDEARIRHFVENYLSSDEIEPFVARILPQDDRDREDRRHLFQLARNPVLLSALILAYRTGHGTLPDTLGGVIKAIVTELWERERARQMSVGLPHDEMEAAFSSLAFVMVDADMGSAVSHNYALDHLGDERLLRAGVGAYLIEERGGRVAFYHELLLEYFAAVGLLRAGLLTRLSYPRFDLEERRLPARWDSKIVLLTGFVSSPDSVILNISEVDPFLAMICILDGTPASDGVRQQVLDRVRYIAEDPAGDGRLEAISLLIEIGDEQASAMLLHIQRHAAWETRLAAARLWERVPVSPLPGLIAVLNEWDQQMREAMALAMQQLGESALPVLFKAVREGDWSVRRAAVWALGESRDPAASPALVNLLTDNEYLVRREAVLALGWVHDEASIPALLERMRDSNRRVRKAAAEALSAFDPVAIPDLLVLLTDSDPDIRRLAVEALGAMQADAALEAVLRALSDSSPEVRGAAVEAAAIPGHVQAVEPLKTRLLDTTRPHAGKRRICDMAADALKVIGTEDALAAVSAWLATESAEASDDGMRLLKRSDDQEIRPEKSAQQAKGRLQEVKRGAQRTRRLPELQKALRHPDWQTRRRAVEALGGTGAPEAVPDLVNAAHDEDAFVRLAAVQALERIGSRAAILGLLRTLQDHDFTVSDAAADALSRIGKPAVPGLLKALKSKRPNMRGASIEALRKIGDASAVPALIECLKDVERPWLADRSIGEMAAAALEQIGTPEALAAVVQYKRERTAPTAPAAPEPKTEQPAVASGILAQILKTLVRVDDPQREEAAKTLREYARNMQGADDPSVIGPLCDALRAGDWFARWAVAEALGWIHDRSALPALLDALNDQNMMTRIAVIRALEEIKDKSAAPALRKLLSDSQSLVREAVLDALSTLSGSDYAADMLNALNDPDPFVQRAAANALGNCAYRDATPRLIEMVASPFEPVQRAAITSLGKIGDPRAVEVLKGCLYNTSHGYHDSARVYSEEPPLNETVAEALAAIGTPEALVALNEWRKARSTSG